MELEEKQNLEYISKVFKGLPNGRKEGLLHTARQLLKIQDNDTFPLPPEKSTSQNESRRVL